MEAGVATGDTKCYRNCEKQGCTQPPDDFDSKQVSELINSPGFVDCKQAACTNTMKGMFKKDTCGCCPVGESHAQTACYPNADWKTNLPLPLMAPQTVVGQKCMWSSCDGKCKDYCAANGGEYANAFECKCPGDEHRDKFLFAEMMKCKTTSGGCGKLDPTACDCVCKENPNQWPTFAAAKSYCDTRKAKWNCDDCTCLCDKHEGVWHGSLKDPVSKLKTVQQADIACHGQKFYDNDWIRVIEAPDDPSTKVCVCEALPTEPCCPDDILDGELRGRLVNSQAGAICANRTGSDGKKGVLVGEKKLCCCSVGPNGETRTQSGQCPRVGQPAQQQQQQQSSGNSTAAASSDLQQKKDKDEKDVDDAKTDMQQKKSSKKDKKKDDDEVQTEVEKEDKEDKKNKKSKKKEDSEEQQDLERDVDAISELRTDVKNLVEEVA